MVPHRVTKINLYNADCIPSEQVSTEYTSFNKIRKIFNDTASLDIKYGFDRQRNFLKYTIRGTVTKTKIYVGGLFEIEYTGNKTKETNYVRGGGGVVATYVVDSGVGKTYFWLKDHLGSLTMITDSTGQKVQEFSYDAWGKRRNADWTPLFSKNSLSVARGFTGHEHYDLFDLVDMNGRVYDPVIGRFTSADPYIQDAYNLQAFNHYSYVLNNPLSDVDPSGFISFKNAFRVVAAMYTGGSSLLAGKQTDQAGKWVKENRKTIAIVAVAVAVSCVTGGAGGVFVMGTGFWAGLGTAVLSGAAAGFAASFTATMLYGGTVSDALKSGAKGAAIGAVSAGLTYGVGSGSGALRAADGGATAASVGVKVAGHAVVQGAMEEADGGQFQHGFYAGAVSAGFGAATEGNSRTARLIGAAAAGGTTSAMSGGKFSNGAITGAYVMLFNDFLHEQPKKPKSLTDADFISCTDNNYELQGTESPLWRRPDFICDVLYPESDPSLRIEQRDNMKFEGKMDKGMNLIKLIGPVICYPPYRIVPTNPESLKNN